MNSVACSLWWGLKLHFVPGWVSNSPKWTSGYLFTNTFLLQLSSQIPKIFTDIKPFFPDLLLQLSPEAQPAHQMLSRASPGISPKNQTLSLPVATAWGYHFKPDGPSVYLLDKQFYYFPVYEYHYFLRYLLVFLTFESHHHRDQTFGLPSFV